jgi:hypothetical protein
MMPLTDANVIAQCSPGRGFGGEWPPIFVASHTEVPLAIFGVLEYAIVAHRFQIVPDALENALRACPGGCPGFWQVKRSDIRSGYNSREP